MQSDVSDSGSVPGLGWSPGGGRGYPPQYSFLVNSMDRKSGGLWSTGHKELGTTEALSTHTWQEVVNNSTV